MPRHNHDLSDDFFADTRMSFGDHLEELRTHLLRALKGLLFFVFIGFGLDALGTMLEWPWLGVGRPMMKVITAPVREKLKEFYDRRMQRLLDQRDKGVADAVTTTSPQTMRLRIPGPALAQLRGNNNANLEPVDVTVEVDPVHIYKASQKIQEHIRPPELTTLSVQESMVVYIKVSLLCGLVLASPWVFYQIWSFVAAGLYPHEKHYVHKYLPLSVGLFIGGILLCQFAVIPQSIGALLWFNDWIGLTPDLRLNEWLSFAIMLPLVFGVSFQTPLVMLFLERLGIMTVDTYWKAWRAAVMIMAVFAAIITPTPDAVTMLAMLVPLIGLYFLGIYLCQWTGSGRSDRNESDDTSDTDALIEA